uniref:Uncharacterized protein n=1 Tax=Eutreptiella gymnastica TaxID=73025 RepID=A0A7S4GFL1_9EUGL
MPVPAVVGKKGQTILENLGSSQHCAGNCKPPFYWPSMRVSAMAIVTRAPTPAPRGSHIHLVLVVPQVAHKRSLVSARGLCLARPMEVGAAVEGRLMGLDGGWRVTDR